MLNDSKGCVKYICNVTIWLYFTPKEKCNEDNYTYEKNPGNGSGYDRPYDPDTVCPGSE